MMSKTFLFILAGIILLPIVGGVGYIAGHRQGFRLINNHLRTEVEGNLLLTLEEVARIRTGDQEGAIELMEQRLDSGVLSLSQGKPWDETPESVKKKLILLKAYRTKFPPKESAPHLDKALKMIPELVLPAKWCSEALNKLFVEEPVSVIEQ
jgi:hypothetical protein